jgi:WD40 repeat protein
MRDESKLDRWRLDSGDREPVASFEFEEKIGAVAASPKGRYLAVCAKTVPLVDTATQREVIFPFDHSNDLTSVSFGPRGDRLITGSFDRTTRFWAIPDGESYEFALRHKSDVIDVVSGPTGKCFASVQKDGLVRVWRFPRRTEAVARIPFNTNETFVALSDDGKYLVPAGWNWERASKSTRVHEVATGKPVGELLESPGFLNGARFFPDGKSVVLLSSSSNEKHGETFEDMRSMVRRAGFRCGTGSPERDGCPMWRRDRSLLELTFIRTVPSWLFSAPTGMCT